MANMSYCRFENTYPDLRDCYDAMGDDDLSPSEAKNRKWIIELAKDIVNEYGDEEYDD